MMGLDNRWWHRGSMGVDELNYSFFFVINGYLTYLPYLHAFGDESA
jgi:hypothetical protein